MISSGKLSKSLFICWILLSCSFFRKIALQLIERQPCPWPMPRGQTLSDRSFCVPKMLSFQFANYLSSELVNRLSFQVSSCFSRDTNIPHTCKICFYSVNFKKMTYLSRLMFLWLKKNILPFMCHLSIIVDSTFCEFENLYELSSRDIFIEGFF